MFSTRAISCLLTPLAWSSIIALRCAWLNIGWLLLGWDLGGQTAEFMKGTINLLPQLSALIAIEFDRGAGQAPIGSMDDSHPHPQIVGQFGNGRRRRPGITLPLSFQEQLRLIENAQPDRRRSVSPGGVQLPGFAAGKPMRRKRFGHALTVFQARTCYRYQELHGHMGRDRTAADLSLHALGKLIDQRQTARYPTRAAIKPARQLVETIATALRQFG